MDDTTFRARALERLGPLREDEADRAIVTTLRVLAEACSRRLSEHLARALPPSAAAVVDGVVEHDRGGDAIAIVARTARREGVSPAIAFEHVTGVASVVGECLDDEVIALARSELLPSVAGLLRPRVRGPAPARPDHEAHRRSTLSEGRPGSREPVSSARHPASHVDSVSGVAHADERLSAAHGTRQEQEHRTLAEGHSKRS